MAQSSVPLYGSSPVAGSGFMFMSRVLHTSSGSDATAMANPERELAAICTPQSDVGREVSEHSLCLASSYVARWAMLTTMPRAMVGPEPRQRLRTPSSRTTRASASKTPR